MPAEYSYFYNNSKMTVWLKGSGNYKISYQM